MKFQFWSVGKNHEPYVKEGIDIFTKRVSNYYTSEWNIISMPKNAASLSEKDIKKKEGENIISLLQKEDFLVLLDENGKMLTSEGLAILIQSKANESVRNMVFLIGGSFGVSDTVKQRADFIWSLSKLVFPHQLVRLLLTEQVYRACSINRNEKYHHS